MSDEIPVIAQIEMKKGGGTLHWIKQDDVDEGDQLVRREDVLQKIDRVIEDKTDNISRFKGKPQILLEDLREEVENQ